MLRSLHPCIHHATMWHAMQSVFYAAPSAAKPEAPLRLSSCSSFMAKPSIKAAFLKTRPANTPRGLVKPFPSKDVIRLLEKGRYTMEQLQRMCHYLYKCVTYLQSDSPWECFNCYMCKSSEPEESRKVHKLAATIERVISCSERFDMRSEEERCRTLG